MHHDDDQLNDLPQSDHGEMVEAGEAPGFGADGFEGGDFAVTAPVKKSMNTSVLIVLGVVVLAAGGLWSMRSMAIAMANSTVDKGLEEAIEAALVEMGGGASASRQDEAPESFDGEEIGEVLVDDRTAKQVALEDVQKNPFAFTFLEGTHDVAVDPVIEEPDEERLAREFTTRVEEAVTKLRVLMILGGSDPMANISGRIVHVGDTLYDDLLGVELVVEEIVPGTVYLVGENRDLGVSHEIPLRLHQGG